MIGIKDACPYCKGCKEYNYVCAGVTSRVDYCPFYHVNHEISSMDQVVLNRYELMDLVDGFR